MSAPRDCFRGLTAPAKLALALRDGQLQTTAGKLSIARALQTNLRAASLVALVSLALSIGIGIASGATPVAGLRAAIWGGAACGIFGSSPFSIVGPAGALSGMLSTYSSKWGAGILPWIAIVSGAFCCAFVRLGLTRYCLFVPKSVFEGFTLSVALTIGLKQINYAFGLSGMKPHVEFLDNLWESLSHLNQAQWGSMVLFFPLTISLLFLMRTYPKIPWMVCLPLLTIFFGYFFRGEDSGWNLPTLQTKFGELPNTIAVLPDTASLTKLSASDIGGVILAGLTVAFVSILETLISAKIAENKTVAESKRNDLGRFDDSVEIYAVSLGQILSGLCSGLPCTGVFVRTNLNQANGANHTLSQLLNALFVLVVTAVAMPVFSYIPCASVAALLVTASIRMVPAHFLHHLWKISKFQFFLCIAIGIVCTIFDPVLGILGGTLLSFLAAAMSSSLNQKTCVVDDFPLPLSHGSSVSLRLVKLMGEITFSNAAAVVQMGTEEPNPRRSLFAADSKDLSYLIASLSEESESNLTRVSVAVQTADTQIDPVNSSLTSASNICICVLDVSRVTLVDIDGADALGTIGLHLARLTKKVRDASPNSSTVTSQSHVYVVVGNEAPKGLFKDMWLNSKLEDGMVFRSIHGALREWHESVQHLAAVSTPIDTFPISDCILRPDFFLLSDSAIAAVSALSASPPSPVLQSRPAIMRNREGSFSMEMRSRQGSFHL